MVLAVGNAFMCTTANNMAEAVAILRGLHGAYSIGINKLIQQSSLILLQGIMKEKIENLQLQSVFQASKDGWHTSQRWGFITFIGKATKQQIG